MTELRRQTILYGLHNEQIALNDLLPRFDDQEWHTLSRDDGWSVHDITAHIADVHLSMAALGGITRRARPSMGVTLPMMPDGRINVERLNMLRYQTNRELTRETVTFQLTRAFGVITGAINALDEKRLAGPGPYGPAETMLEWLRDLVMHIQEHRVELEEIYDARS